METGKKVKRTSSNIKTNNRTEKLSNKYNRNNGAATYTYAFTYLYACMYVCVNGSKRNYVLHNFEQIFFFYDCFVASLMFPLHSFPFFCVLLKFFSQFLFFFFLLQEVQAFCCVFRKVGSK